MNMGEAKTITEIIDNLDVKYYKKKSDDLDKEIYNIESGLPRYQGIFGEGGRIVPPREAKKEIEKLKKEQKEFQKQELELLKVIDELKSSSEKLQRLAEKDVLLSSMRFLLTGRFQESAKADKYQKNRNDYLKLYYKSNTLIEKDKFKISKDMYQLIKKNQRAKIYNGISVLTEFKTNNHVMSINGNNDFNTAISKEISSKYALDGSLGELGVDVSLLENAKKGINSEITPSTLTWNGEDSFDKLNNIKQAMIDKIDVKGRNSQLSDLEYKYTEIVNLSRETWFLGEVLKAFQNTSIVNTEFYIGIKDMLMEQERD